MEREAAQHSLEGMRIEVEEARRGRDSIWVDQSLG